MDTTFAHMFANTPLIFMSGLIAAALFFFVAGLRELNESRFQGFIYLALLISYLLGSSVTLPCPAEANVNRLGLIDLSDLCTLIAYLVNGTGPLPNCP